MATGEAGTRATIPWKKLQNSQFQKLTKVIYKIIFLITINSRYSKIEFHSLLCK